MKPKHLNRPQVAGCSKGDKSYPLHVSRRDLKKSKYTSDTFFPKMVSVILGCFYHTDICLSASFSYQFFKISYLIIEKGMWCHDWQLWLRFSNLHQAVGWLRRHVPQADSTDGSKWHCTSKMAAPGKEILQLHFRFTWSRGTLYIYQSAQRSSNKAMLG